MEVKETFCIPSECDNSQDLNDNLVVKWFDAHPAFRCQRSSIWLYDYSDTMELECPSMAVLIIVSVIVSIVIVLLSIPLGLFLFKAPKERGRVMRGAHDEDDDHHEDTPVENMPALVGDY